MDIAGLLDDMKERVRTRGATPLVGGGLLGSFTRGLLGLDPSEEDSKFSQDMMLKAYQTGQALSNTPTPLALAVAPAAIVKGAKSAKKALPQEKALETARKNAVEMLGLPENNTAMDRARAMGFKESGYTGTNRDFREYDISQAAGSGSGSREGPLGAWLTDDPRVAQSFAEWSSRGQGGDVIYPLMIRGDKPYEPSSYAKIKEILDENTKFVRPPYRMMQDKIDYAAAKKALENKGDYVALRNTMTDAIDKPITQYLVPNTSRLRSRFAAFDPKRINDPNLLASLAAFGIGIPTYGLLEEE